MSLQLSRGCSASLKVSPALLFKMKEFEISVLCFESANVETGIAGLGNSSIPHDDSYVRVNDPSGINTVLRLRCCHSYFRIG